MSRLKSPLERATATKMATKWKMTKVMRMTLTKHMASKRRNCDDVAGELNRYSFLLFVVYPFSLFITFAAAQPEPQCEHIVEAGAACAMR